MDTFVKKAKDGAMITIENCRLVAEDTALLTCRTRAEIDLAGGVIRKMWKLMGFVRSRTYELDTHVAVKVKDRSTILEGYRIPSFGVYLINNGREIRMSSTDELKKACLVQNRLIEFLEAAAVKCPASGRTSASNR
jgi:hypothetical protein